MSTDTFNTNQTSGQIIPFAYPDYRARSGEGGNSTVTHLPLAAPPIFEGHEVAMSRVKLSAANLDLETDHQIDEVVQMIVTGVVTSVAHTVDARGQLVRQHTIKLQAATAIPGVES